MSIRIKGKGKGKGKGKVVVEGKLENECESEVYDHSYIAVSQPVSFASIDVIGPCQ